MNQTQPLLIPIYSPFVYLPNSPIYVPTASQTSSAQPKASPENSSENQQQSKTSNQ